MDQCHGAEVAVVDAVPDVAPQCDAVVTTSSDLALAVLVADCVPVLLASPDGRRRRRPRRTSRHGRRASSPRRSRRCATSGPAPSTRSSDPRCAVAATRCRPRCATSRPRSSRSARRSPGRARPPIDVAAGVVAQLRALERAGRPGSPAAPARATTSTPTARDGTHRALRGRRREGVVSAAPRRPRGPPRRGTRAGRGGAAGRRARPTPSTLVVVTKFFPASDVDLLAELGVTDIGENRDQEAAAKVGELPAPRRAHRPLHRPAPDQQGRLRRAVRRRRPLPRPRQARPGARPRGRHGGARPRRARPGRPRRRRAAAEAWLPRSCSPWRRRRGHRAPAAARADGRRPARGAGPAGLRTAARARRAACAQEHPQARWMSAGMSADLEDAVAEGATHLRVGSAILGSRESHR